MLASLTEPHIWTANLLVIGLVQGLIVSLIAMGIVLVYRSSRVINFAVGDLGVPAAAVLAILVGKDGWPYWPGLIFAVLIGTATGTVVEMAVIRRLSKAPRVIVLVATIGIAELCQAVVHSLPDYRTGSLQVSYPSPMNSQWTITSFGVGPLHVHDVTITGPQLLAIIVVPTICLGLWWLLGHTRFGEAVQATATNADLARLTGVSPKVMSTAIWTIAGFLSTVSVILYATAQGSTELVSIGPETLLLGLSAALIARMTSFPKAVGGAIFVGLLYQILVFNFPNETGLVQFVLFILVLVLVARISSADDAGGESFSFAPRVPPIPERLREIWWVRHMGRILAGFGLFVAIILPLLVTQSAHQLTYSVILAFAICAVSVTVLTGWGGQLSLGQMAFAGIGAMSGAAFSRGITLNIGWRSHRLINGAIQPVPLIIVLASDHRRDRRRDHRVAREIPRAPTGEGDRGDRRRARVCRRCSSGGSSEPCRSRCRSSSTSSWARSSRACLAVLVGTGALRVKGLLLAVSTLAFAIAAESYIFGRTVFTGSEGALTVNFSRGKLGPVDLASLNRNYYYFVLACLVIVLAVAGHLRRTGIGRTIIGVRENEPAVAALTVSPTRAKLTAFAFGGFIAGLGGALLGGLVVTIGFTERFFTVSDSLNLVAIAVIGGLGSLAGAVTGALWVIGLPAFWPNNQTILLLTSSLGLLIVLLYFPGGFTQIGYSLRGAILGWLEKRLPERAMKTTTAPPASLTRVATPGSLALNADGSVLVDEPTSPCASAASSRSTMSTSAPNPARSSASSARTARESRRSSTPSAGSSPPKAPSS